MLKQLLTCKSFSRSRLLRSMIASSSSSTSGTSMSSISSSSSLLWPARFADDDDLSLPRLD